MRCPADRAHHRRERLGRLIGSGYLAYNAGLPNIDRSEFPSGYSFSFSYATTPLYPSNSIDRQVSYTYDEVGNVIKQTDWAITTSNAYDSLKRLVAKHETPVGSSSYPTCRWSYVYDIVDNRTSVVLEVEAAATSSYSQSYIYDGLNRLTETVFSPTNATATRALYVYNENGKLARVTAKYGGSTVNSRYYGYDTENRLTSIAVTNGGGQRMLSLDYRYNSAQQITQAIEHGGRLGSMMLTMPRQIITITMRATS